MITSSSKMTKSHHPAQHLHHAEQKMTIIMMIFIIFIISPGQKIIILPRQ